MDFDYSTLNSTKPDFEQINVILKKAYRNIHSAQITLKDDQEAAFTLAYESMLKTTLALMHSRGFRPKTQLGHHKILVDYAKYVLKQFSSITTIYERMRKKRNKIIYDVVTVTPDEAKQAIGIAQKYFAIVEEKISSDNPQQKLWQP